MKPIKPDIINIDARAKILNLRVWAKTIRECAMRAENARDEREELDRAKRCELEANRLEQQQLQETENDN